MIYHQRSEKNIKSMAKTVKVVVYRSAVTGKFVKESFAKDHKRTTEREHVKKKAN